MMSAKRQLGQAKLFYVLWIGILIFLASCSGDKDKKPDANPFVKINNGQFQLKGNSFYPVVLNYLATLQADKCLMDMEFTGDQLLE